MKMTRILLIAAFLWAILTSLACNAAREPTQTSPEAQTSAPSSITDASLELAEPAQTATITPTSLPEPTLTAPPSPTLRPPPTLTPAPFLPANLNIISPQNASELKPVAILSMEGAGVVAYSPDSRRVAAGLFRSNDIKIWDLATGQELLALSGHVDPRIISYLAFSPDGMRLASAAQGWDAPNDSLILWDASTGDELQRFSGLLGAVSPDWRVVALSRREEGQKTTLVLSDLASREALHTLKAPGDIYAISFSPQGQLVAAKMYNVFQDLFAFWSAGNGRLVRTQYDWVGFSFSPDGRFIAALLDTGSGSDTGALNVFDATTFKWIKIPAKNADSLWFTFPAFSPDGQILAASTGDEVTLWDTQSWKELASLPAPGPTGLTFSPDGRLLTSYPQSGPLQLWGVVAGR